MSGEVMSDVADDYRSARRTVEAALNQVFEQRSYGPGIS